jgi:hypothetical protein
MIVNRGNHLALEITLPATGIDREDGGDRGAELKPVNLALEFIENRTAEAAKCLELLRVLARPPALSRVGNARWTRP